MATPYFQFAYESVPSTQDVARQKLDDLPVLVVSAAQSEGRGRTGNEWITAPKAVAVSFAYHHEAADQRPVSLMAGVAATRAVDDVGLKWPNDVVREHVKLGGILVERSDATTVVGLGLNLWWPESPDGMGAVYESEPAKNHHVEVGVLWGAELARLIDAQGWPLDDYRSACVTLGEDITWEPAGSGRAFEISTDGGLLVDTDEGTVTLHSGVVHSVRS